MVIGVALARAFNLLFAFLHKLATRLSNVSFLSILTPTITHKTFGTNSTFHLK